MRNLFFMAAIPLSMIAQTALANPSNVGEPANPTFQLDGSPITSAFTSYSFDFTAGSSLTNLTFAFRDDPAFITLDDVSVVGGSGANLLINGDFESGPVNAQAPLGWTYLNQYGASAGGIVEAGAGVGGSNGYSDGAVQAYDAITQGIETTIGGVYTVSFMAMEDSGLSTYSALSTNGDVADTGGNGINVAVYAQNGIPAPASAVPETATWLMMILGFGALGGVMRRAHRKSEERFTSQVRAIAAA